MAIPPEVWLRGPIEGIVPLLQPAAHALVQAGEDVIAAVEGLTHGQLWARPGGVASIGFHLAHLPSSVGRLVAYSRGESLTAAQLETLAAERTVHADRPEIAPLLAALTTGLNAAIAHLRTLSSEGLLAPRAVGRKQLPSTTLGLIFHAAEHASRHAGQVVTLAKIVRG